MSTLEFSKYKLTDTLLLCIILFAFEIIVTILTIFDWHYGIFRGVITVIVLLMLIFFRFSDRTSNDYANVISTKFKIIILLAGLSTISLSVYAIVKTLQTSNIELDHGETAWRSARLLRIGRNPYGYGEIVDYYVFVNNLDNLSHYNLEPEINKDKILASLIEYDRTLDPNLQHRLLPIASQSEIARPIEAETLGYKYGPLTFIITMPFVTLNIAAIVPLLNNIASFALFAIMFILMYKKSNNLQYCAMGLVALFMDPAIRMYYILLTANDVWPLLFCSISVYYYFRGKMDLCAVFLAIAFGFKILPSVLFFPLLLKSRSPRPIALLVGTIAIIYGPWFIWDPVGIIDNVFLWPILISKDSSSWIFFVPSYISVIAKLLAFTGIVTLWLRFLTGLETRLFWTLAVINLFVILVAPVFHTNYLPWASIWIVAALVEGAPGQISPSRIGILRPA